MKYILLPAISFLIGLTLFGQSPILVKDINPGPMASSISNHPSIQIDDVIYFVGDISGKRDLYSLRNGEVELISQLCSASCNFFEVFLFRFGNKLLFLKRIDSKVNQLWSTDGTFLGTTMIFEYPGSFKTFAIGNNGKGYLGLGNRNTFQDEVFITDGSASGTKKISTDVRLGSDEEAFGAPISYENGIAFAEIFNDSLKLFSYNDESLSLLSAIKVKSGSTIHGLKLINEGDLVILIHSDNAMSSELFNYDNQSKKIEKDITLPFTNQKFPYFKDFGKDSLVLFYHNGGHFLLTGKPLKTINITPFSDDFFSSESMYYTYFGKSAYLTKDKQANFGQRAKFVIFEGDPQNTITFTVEDSNSPSLIGYDKYAFYGIDDPVFKSGEITIFDLIHKTSKQIFKFTQTFSSNQIKLLGLQNSRLYFFANLDQNFGKELYYINTDISTSSDDIISNQNDSFS